jgi:hypothetical protein
MSKVIMIGCDLHDRWTLLKVAVGTEAPMKRSFETSDTFGMIQWLKDFADRKDAARIVFAYEASGQGFGLYDQTQRRWD